MHGSNIFEITEPALAYSREDAPNNPPSLPLSQDRSQCSQALLCYLFRKAIEMWCLFFLISFLQSISASTQLERPTSESATYAVQTPPLDTPWTYDLGTDPWTMYPRPQMQRADWISLNGIWQYQNISGYTNDQPCPSREVLIPSCLESALSGIQGSYTTHSWFSRNFSVPVGWQSRAVILNFGAVDYEATVYVNGRKVVTNIGGYSSFSADISDYIDCDQTNELLVSVWDPTDSDDIVIPIGKQTLRPSHIFYTPCSGIWQSVWLEVAPKENYITQLDLDGDMNGTISVMVHTSARTQDSVDVVIYNSGQPDRILGSVSVHANYPSAIKLPEQPRLWSPDSPVLYDVVVRLGEDTVKSYVGFRTIGHGEVNGIVRPLLNGEFLFTFGTLDQGYWPDGIYTPPNHEAMVYDLEILKALGFNMIRKHIKVEPALFYTACDRLGLLVWQDMPSPRPLQNKYTYPNGTHIPYLPNATEQAAFTLQLQAMVHQHKSHPCIFAWTIYNEGWGQPSSPLPNTNSSVWTEATLTDLIHTLDPTRLISATSGWHDHGAGNFSDTHTYASPKCGTPYYKIPSSPYDATRIAIQGEFGGIGQNLSITHLWNVSTAIDTVNQTYELVDDYDTYNYRAHQLLMELTEQVLLFACSGAVWTQTTDVEGELNGLLSYDRRILRADIEMWRRDIQGLYDAAETRGARRYEVPAVSQRWNAGPVLSKLWAAGEVGGV